MLTQDDLYGPFLLDIWWKRTHDRDFSRAYDEENPQMPLGRWLANAYVRNNPAVPVVEHFALPFEERRREADEVEVAAAARVAELEMQLNRVQCQLLFARGRHEQAAAAREAADERAAREAASGLTLPVLEQFCELIDIRSADLEGRVAASTLLAGCACDFEYALDAHFTGQTHEDRIKAETAAAKAAALEADNDDDATSESSMVSVEEVRLEGTTPQTEPRSL